MEANRYNLRGLFLVLFFLLLLFLHLVIATVAEVRWRMQARWVAMASARKQGVQLEVHSLEEQEKAFLRRRREEIEMEKERKAQLVALEGEQVLAEAQGMQQKPTTTTALDLRQAGLEGS